MNDASKVTYDSSFEAPDGTKFNEMPKGLVEVPEEEFANSVFFHYTPKYIEYRQIEFPSIDDLGHYHTVLLHWYEDNTGAALVNASDKVRFFLFGCKHVYRQMTVKEITECDLWTPGRWINHLVCENCGHQKIVDSGD